MAGIIVVVKRKFNLVVVDCYDDAYDKNYGDDYENDVVYDGHDDDN